MAVTDPPTAPPPRKYNPGFLSDDELVASFCVRTSEFASIVEVLRECTGSANPHQIVIGPRGSGKTSLLLRVAAEVRRDGSLSSGFFPVVFAEESYEVGTAGELWLECLSRLADQAPHREGGPDLRLTVEDLRTIRDDRTLGERCLAALLDFSDREGKRLVLMVENLNMMFRDMADSREAGWRLRQTLQTEPRIVLLASATSRFDEIDHPDHALYDLFRVLALRPLDNNECAVLWEAVSDQHRPPKTIRSLEILTGGSPRLLAIVARFGAGRSFRELMAELLDLVDDHTEYFKSHLESLPPQERRVYLALADLWRPALTKEIAERARLETSKCSAHLTRLIERGAVLVAGGSARRKRYYLSERLYNIFHLLRHRRRPDRLIEALLRFMASYYPQREWEDLKLEMRSLRYYVLEQSIESTRMAGHREELPRRTPEGPRALLRKAFGLEDQNRTEEALAIYDEVVRQFGARKTPTLHESVAEALVRKGDTLFKLNRLEEALATCDEVMRRFEASEIPILYELVAKALVRKGDTLFKLDRLEEALVTCDEVMRRFEASEIPTLYELVAKALVRKGDTLFKLNRLEEALAIYDEVVRRFGERETPTLYELITKALINRGCILLQLNRLEEALTIYDEVMNRFGESETPTLDESVAITLINRGCILFKLDRLEEALTIWNEVVHRFEESKAQTLNKLSGKIPVEKRDIQIYVDRSSEGLPDGWNEVVHRSGKSETPDFIDFVTLAFANKGDTLARLERPTEALAVWDKAVRRFERRKSSALREEIGVMLLNRAKLESKCEQHEAAIKTAGRSLDQHLTTPLNRWRGYLIRAKAILASGDPSGSEQDIEAMFAILPKLDSLPSAALHALMKFSIDLGPARMRELIQASPAVDLLLPLTTALEWELGLEPRVAREVEEVAQDVRLDLAKLKPMARRRDRTAKKEAKPRNTSPLSTKAV